MGHVQDRRNQGRGWVARWVDPAGREVTKSFTRRVDAERHLTNVQHEMLTGAYVDPAMTRTTLDAFYREWSERQPWRDASKTSTESLFRLHILPTFGDRALGSIRRGDVEAWAQGLPLAGQTARLAMQKLSALLEAAVLDGYIPKNPARGAKKPAAEVAPIVPLTGDELERLTEAAPAWFRVAVTLGSAAGLRQGEATGLTEDRVDFLRRTLVVDRQLVTPYNGTPALGPPKTRRSYRTVPLADVALEALSAHLSAFGASPEGFVLHEGGRPVRRQRFGQVWRQARTRAGLPHARFHDTRHTFASILLSGGVSVAAVADYMGHSPTTLLKTYAHLIPADHERARGVVQSAFARSWDGTETGRSVADAAL